jgi:antitoxin component YwqK of YwqJK toxin-antitoxin module
VIICYKKLIYKLYRICLSIIPFLLKMDKLNNVGKLNYVDKLFGACKLYLGDDKYVYKSCGNYIVVLEKLIDSKTNECRFNIADYKYAKYRANKLKTILIINKFDPSDAIMEIQNSCYKEKKVVYRTGEVIEIGDYDYDLNAVCTRGIHYFKTIEQSFFWELLRFHPTYAGTWIEWYDNGTKCSEGEYKEGKQKGKWIYWHTNSTKCSEGEYKGGNKEGKWIYWHANGTKASEGEYKEGKQEGKWIEWDDDGIKTSEGEYKEGNKEGTWTNWYENGTKSSEGECKEGKKEGTWIGWHENGTKLSEGEYKDGKAEGKWITWHKTGFKWHEGEYKEGKLLI